MLNSWMLAVETQTTDTRDFHGNRKSRCIICMSTKKEGRKKGSRFVKAQMADVYEFYFDYTSPIWTNERRVKDLEWKRKVARLCSDSWYSTNSTWNIISLSTETKEGEVAVIRKSPEG
ncbi:hypothetical protein EDB19DRAFT_1829999 [Suillus lakei]|nr:hypothetical protein EDB19DRAFT_1829999 [Suillus lakei]